MRLTLYTEAARRVALFLTCVFVSKKKDPLTFAHDMQKTQNVNGP